MFQKLKLLLALVPILLLTGCSEGNDPIFESLDGNGKLVYAGVIIALGIVVGGLNLLFKALKKNKNPAPPAPEPSKIQPPPLPPLPKTEPPESEPSKMEPPKFELPKEEHKDPI
jgi:hypothetical protein